MVAIFFAFFSLNVSSLLFCTEFITNENYSENILENGISVYILEDFSMPTINILYTVNAGFSAQNQNNTGFFKLYSKLFNSSNFKELEIENLHSQCSSDISSYSFVATPINFEKSLEKLAHLVFEPAFTDKNIKSTLDSMKEEVLQYASTPASFINAGIDSRIYSQEPWKQDSGIYPSLFAKTTPTQARTILNEIAKTFYTPQNSCIFINGCIKKESALNLIEKTFGKYKKASFSKNTNGAQAGNSSRKFVFYDKQFSKDLVQIVMQYTSISVEQCDVAKSAFGNDFSFFKNELLAQKILNIPGTEYINVASSHKQNSSRLIIQSLLEKNIHSPVEQAQMFIETCKNAIKSTPENDFLNAKKAICENFSNITASSTEFMKYLADFKALNLHFEENLSQSEWQNLAQTMLCQPQRISEINTTDLKNSLTTEMPFIFVLVNSDSYNKYKNAFKKAGFEAVNSKNASWFSKKLEKNTNQNALKEKVFQQDFNNFGTKEFISQNRDSISNFTISNGIPISVKKQKSSSKTTMIISINGGKFSTQYSASFQEIMVAAFVANIQKELEKNWQQGFFETLPKVSSEILEESCIIAVECSNEDIELCIKSAGKAIVFGEIQPASADSYVYAVATQNRISNANPINQLYKQAVNYLFKSQVYKNSFYNEDSIENVKYTELLAAYPYFLNASLYSIVLVGNIEEQKIKSIIEETFSLLVAQKKSLYSSTNEKYEEPNFPEQSKRLNARLQHLFYTDISAEDAGPMPAVLVPTKNFCDPVQFWIPAPTLKDSDYDFLLFTAIYFRFFDYMKSELKDQAQDIKLLQPSKRYRSGTYTFINVPHTAKIDSFFADCVKNFLELLKNEETVKKEVEKIKNSWILHKFSNTNSNLEIAKTILQGQSSKEYLDNYEKIINANSQDFERIAQQYLNQIPKLRLYSSDSMN